MIAVIFDSGDREMSYCMIAVIFDSGDREMSDRHVLKLRDKIIEAYGKAWKETEIDPKTSAILESIHICCKNPDLVSL